MIAAAYESAAKLGKSGGFKNDGGFTDASRTHGYSEKAAKESV